MNPEFLSGILSVSILGILTALSPCPLATHLATVSFLVRKTESPRQVLAGAFLYAAGRIGVYCGLLWVLGYGLFSIPPVSQFLQKEMNFWAGPFMILIGMILCGLLSLPGKGIFWNEKLRLRLEKQGVWGAFFLGLIFTLAFCPSSAALFFGGVLPLSMKLESPLTIGVVYGTVTAFPVITGSLLFSFGIRSFGKYFQKAGKVDAFLQTGAGIVFILLGLYLTCVQTLCF